MHDPPDDESHAQLDRDGRVTGALTRLAGRDRDLARAAGAAWDWLVADQPVEALQQSELQDFLWYGLPRKWLAGLADHLFVAEALACLCDEVGLDRYAAVCRSGETGEVLQNQGYTATRHQREVGAGYFDQVAQAIAAGDSSTLALHGSTEEQQFTR